MNHLIKRLAMEPPFRLVTKAILARMRVSCETRSIWHISKRPAYLIGLLEGARQAGQQGHKAISALEFGVAGGDGLIALQEEAEKIESETGIEIRVYGFDMGPGGLPALIGDYRDHPDWWRPGDFKMDEQRLRGRLTSRTTLILGDVNETARTFFETYSVPPLGFISIDLDLYSSTKSALNILRADGMRMLWNTPMYFDDIEFIINHKFAGELLAIDEFNDECANIKIDRWYGVESGRPFSDQYLYRKLYVAHDLQSISKARLDRQSAQLPLK